VLLLALGAAAIAAVVLWVEHAAPPDATARALAWLTRLQQANSGLVAALGGWVVFVVATCLGCPINLCIAACLLVLGPVRGVPVALAGTLASALVLHRIGASIPEGRLPAWLGGREALLRRLRGSVAAIALVRLVPVGPYCIVSLLAGVVRVPRGPYLLGTALGMAPGILLYAVFLDRAQAALHSPHALTVFAAVGSALLIAGAYLACTRWLRRREAR
jgi:uncharacterized membrane protein YdjX (TVP38/TMEM64 family)